MDKSGRLLLEPGTLWKRARERAEYARERNRLHTMTTDYEFVEQGGVSFIVRILLTPTGKDKTAVDWSSDPSDPGQGPSPFLPRDESLFVAEISETHMCLLNKYNVIGHHLLLVTRSYENQESLLTLEDFKALWACMGEFESLGFYNAGGTAGASQRHKHLQVVPLPLAPTGPKIPIEPAVESAVRRDSVGLGPVLPFVHTVVLIDDLQTEPVPVAAAEMLRRYHSLLNAVDLGRDSTGDICERTAPYNFLATRRWMMLVPRSREKFESISINSLGFAGSLLVRDEAQMRTVKEHGPMVVLTRVAQPIIAT